MLSQLTSLAGTDPELIKDVLLTGLALWHTGVHAAHVISEQVGAQKAADWIVEFEQSQACCAKEDWSLSARLFWQNGTPGLMNAYYRGLPFHLISGLAKHAESTLVNGNSRWMISAVEESKTASQAIANDLTGNLDDQKIHRLQVFHVLPAAQFLAIADPDTQAELGAMIAAQLAETHSGTGPYTKSGRDQINQIVPQILTEQLLASQSAWLHLAIADPLLDRLLALGNQSLRHEFETGFVLSLQFLVYYQAALAARPGPEQIRTQQTRIAEYLKSLERENDPFLLDKVHWMRALASQFGMPFAITNRDRVIRQSSAALIGIAQGAYQLPEADRSHFRQICLLTNVRAAVAAFGLPDEADRLNRVRDFFSQVAVARCDAEQSVQEFVHPSRRDFIDKAMSFASTLEAERRPVSTDGHTFPTAPGHTLGALIDEITGPIVASHHRRKAVQKIVLADILNPDKYLEVLGRSIGRFVAMLRVEYRRKSRRCRKDDVSSRENIAKTIREAWESTVHAPETERQESLPRQDDGA